MWPLAKYTQKPSAKEIYLFCRGVNSINGAAKYINGSILPEDIGVPVENGSEKF